MYDVSRDEWVVRDQDNYRVIRYGGNGVTEDPNPKETRIMTMAQQALSVLNSITEEQIRDTAWWDEQTTVLSHAPSATPVSWSS